MSGDVVFAGTYIKTLFMVSYLPPYYLESPSNLNKSKVMIIEKGKGRNSLSERWFCSSISIEVVNEFRYLGMYRTKSLSKEKNLREKIVKALGSTDKFFLRTEV